MAPQTAERSEPEFPGLNAAYFQKTFNEKEAELQASLQTLYRQGEGDRDAFIPLVQRQYEVCQNVAFFAGVPTPTFLMSEAEQVLGLTAQE